MPVFPGHCKVPVNVMTFGFSFCMEGMKSATATYIILHCYLSIIILCAEYQKCVNALFLMLFLFNLCIPNVYSITSFAIFCQKYIFSRQKFGVDLNRCTKSLKNERRCYFLLKVREKNIFRYLVPLFHQFIARMEKYFIWLY